jgi:Zn-dependent protease
MNDNRRRTLILLGVIAVIVALALKNGSLTRVGILFFVALVPSVILHEVMHGVVALAFGDDTAKQAGRLTLNPLAHIDPVWTLLIPGMMVLLGAPAIGMAKPVPVNPRKMRHPRNADVVVALAGPATNIALAAIAGVAFRTVQPTAGVLRDVILAFGIVNVILAVFNLIPLPPLDGSAVLERLLPRQWLPQYMRLRQYGFLILLVVFFMMNGAFGRILDPAVRLWFRLIT